jgi:hypothetical protein
MGTSKASLLTFDGFVLLTGRGIQQMVLGGFASFLGVHVFVFPLLIHPELYSMVYALPREISDECPPVAFAYREDGLAWRTGDYSK